MARHGEILDSFKQKVDNFDYADEEHVTCVSGGHSQEGTTNCVLYKGANSGVYPLQLKMVLIKCCDISNEVRPMEVAEPWVDCLLEEYFMQVVFTFSHTAPPSLKPSPYNMIYNFLL